MTVKPPNPTRQCIPPKPRVDTASAMPASDTSGGRGAAFPVRALVGEERVVWLTAYASSYAEHDHEGALVMADGAARDFAAHTRGEGPPSLFRGDK